MTLSKGSLYPTSDLHGYKNLAPLLRLKTVGGSEGKASACSVGDPGSIPGLGRSPGEGNGNPLQYPCLENPMRRDFHGGKIIEEPSRLQSLGSQSQKRPSDFTFTLSLANNLYSQTPAAVREFQNFLLHYNFSRDSDCFKSKNLVT